MKKHATYLLLMALLMFSGCATIEAMKISQESLEETMRDFNQLIRWQEVSSAALIVSEPLRPAYLDKSSGFNRAKIVEYRVKSVDFSKEQKKATVLVEYDYHLKTGLTIKTAVDAQQWKYFDTTEPKGWRLTSYPPPFP